MNLPLKKSIVIVPIIIVVVLALAAAPSYYFYDKYQKSQMLLENPTEAARAEVKTLVERVSKHIELPNEEPTVATVSDKDKLKDQPFFAKAENGDKVLIYTEAQKAYLYRPSTNKIINFAPVNLGSNLNEASNSAQVQEIKVVLRNGTNTTGLTNRIELEVKKVLPQAQIVKKENATKFDYEKTLVIPLNDYGKQASTTLVSSLGATLGELPEGESKPTDANILIILGKDII